MMTMDRSKVRRRPVMAPTVSGPSTSGSTLFNRRDGAGGSPVLSLHGKDFVLDIENARLLQQLTTEIEKLGGRVVTEVSEEKKPYCVVSDSVHMGKIERLKEDEISPQMLKCLPMLVREAIQMRVRYRSCKAFVESLDKLKMRVRTQKKVMAAPSKKPAASTSSVNHHPGMSILTAPYLKLEDNRGAFAPLHKQFTSQSACQRVYLGKHMGKSLFHRNHHPDAVKSEKSPNEKQKLAMLPKSGFCELCCKKFENSKEHFASREHTMSISQPGLWTSVDELCGSFLEYVSSANPRSRSRPPRNQRHSPPSPSDR